MKHKSGNRLKNLGVFAFEDVFPYVGMDQPHKTFLIEGVEIRAKMASLRLCAFKANPVCACCGLPGTKLILQTSAVDQPLERAAKNSHFNLFGETPDSMVLMTVDHIFPLSLGGKNRLDNTQTLCTVCNYLKGNIPFSLEQLKELRNQFDIWESSGIKDSQLVSLFKDYRNKMVKRDLCHVTMTIKGGVEQVFQTLSGLHKRSFVNLTIKMSEAAKELVE